MPPAWAALRQNAKRDGPPGPPPIVLYCYCFGLPGGGRACYAFQLAPLAGAGAVFPGLAMPWRIPPPLERVSRGRPPGSPGEPRRRYGQRPAHRLASDLQQLPPALGRFRGPSDAARPAWAALVPAPPAVGVPLRGMWRPVRPREAPGGGAPKSPSKISPDFPRKSGPEFCPVTRASQISPAA